MKLNGIKFIVLALTLLMIISASLSSASPYWVKPGFYTEYAAMRYDPYIQY